MTRKTTPTHVLLNQIELSSSASSVTFSNIPQGYGDLVLVGSGIAIGDTLPVFRINGDSGSNYPYVHAGANSSTHISTSGTFTWVPLVDNTATSGQFFNFNASIFDYSAVDKHTTTLARGNLSNTTHMIATRWANLAAVTSVEFRLYSGGNYGAGVVFSLYGLVA